jgi:serine/threonine-protein kinase SRPK3
MASVGLEQALINYKVLHPDDVAPAAQFIRSCLRLDPAQRLTAEQLAADDWLMMAEGCLNYRPV